MIILANEIYRYIFLQMNPRKEHFIVIVGVD